MPHKSLMNNRPLALINKGRIAIVLAVACAWLPASLTAQTPVPGSTDSASSSLPQLGDGSALASAEERRLGDRIAAELFRDPDYLDDPVLADYVQGVWQPLLAAARLRGELTPELDERFAWHIMLGRDRTVNAFALPGGYLGVNLGLLAVVSSRDELASVLGHELSHVTQRHISRLIAKDSAQTPWLIGAMILGALAASKSADAGSALMVGGQAVAAQNQLNFSRDMEREADRVGFGVMTQAGFDPLGFVTMFDKLQQAARLNDSGNYPYLRSHPLTTERIADMQSRLPLGAPHAVANAPTLLHAMMSTRAKVLSNPGVDALRSWLAQADDAGSRVLPVAQQAGTVYGAALAASLLREPVQARRYLTRLQTLTAVDMQATAPVRWLGAEIDLNARDLTPAQLTSLATSLGLTQGASLPLAQMRRPLLILQAQLALQLKQADILSQSIQNLQTWLSNQPQDALVWQTLAGLYGAQNQGLRALRAEAEAQAARLDYTGAMDRLRAAQDLMRSNEALGRAADHIDASIIDTRQRQIAELLKQQALKH